MKDQNNRWSRCKFPGHVFHKYWPLPKGPGNIYGNAGPGNLQRDHRLFWSFSRTGPPVILRVDFTEPPLISVSDFNGVKDYFGVLQYGAMDYIETLPVFLIVNSCYGANNYFAWRFQRGPWRILDKADTGPYTILYRKINGATVIFTSGHRTFLYGLQGSGNRLFQKILFLK